MTQVLDVEMRYCEMVSGSNDKPSEPVNDSLAFRCVKVVMGRIGL